MFKRIKHVHFVGIGGIGMSGIAEVLLNLGYKVTGSDVRSTPITERLERCGATIYPRHAAENSVGAHVVVTSSAVRSDNPEIQEAERHKIPVIARAEMLAELARLKYSVTAAGTPPPPAPKAAGATHTNPRRPAPPGLPPAALLGHPH